MKKYYNKILILNLIAIILYSCTKNDMKGKWIYSLEYSGIAYPGMIYDFENNSMTRYSLLSKNNCDTISLKDSVLFFDTTSIGTIVWKNDYCFVINGHRDSLVFHKVPNLHLSDSIEFVSNFLTSNPILYKDNSHKLTYYFDTTLNDRGLYNSSFKNFNYPQYGLEYSSWKLDVINGSIILLNQDPISLFPKNLLITNITNDSISGIIIGFPENIHNSIIRAISNYKIIDFEYERFSLTKVNRKTEEEIELLKEKLISKNWKLTNIDSTYISFGRVLPNEETRIFPKNLNGLEYKFYADNKYKISVKDRLYTGRFDISIDGKYIILDENMYYDYCIGLIEVDSLLKIEHIMKIQEAERKYRTYSCEIKLK